MDIKNTRSFIRRGPYTVGPVFNATPVRFIPKIKVILRQPVVKATLLAGAVFFARPIHSTASSVAVKPKQKLTVLRQVFRARGSIINVSHTSVNIKH